MKLEEDDGNENEDEDEEEEEEEEEEDDDDDDDDDDEEPPRIELQQMTQSVRGSSTISYVFLRKGAGPLLVVLRRETMSPLPFSVSTSLLSLFLKEISVVSLTISRSP